MKTYISCLSLLLFAAFSHASTVSVSEAQSIAVTFIKLNSAYQQPVPTLVYTKTDANGIVDFYVFDFAPLKGFVIVAGDDNVIPILAYSTQNNFTTNFRHIGLGNWITETGATISSALSHGAMADTRIQGQWTAYRQGLSPAVQRSGSSVGPLCYTSWDQENDISTPPPYLYNLFCPWNATDSQRCLVGCVAIAMAQIMKFWNYPAQGTGSFSYSDDQADGYANNYGTQSSNFAAHTYQWSSMPNALTDSTTGAADSAIDLLLYDCAVSVGMDFGDDNQDGSGASSLLAEQLQYGDSNCTQVALPRFFGYDADSIYGVFRSAYTDSMWLGLLENELNIGRPFIYEGTDSTQGGDAWICDGYNTMDQLHMNWGIGGYADGYFSIDNFTIPVDYNPILDNDALLGIIPATLPSTNTCRAYFVVYADSVNASGGDTAGVYYAYNESTGNYGSNILWSFGDGNISTDLYPTHYYSQPGFYDVCLTVGDSGTSCYSTYCDSLFYVSRALLAMNAFVVMAPAGLNPIPADMAWSISPNPVVNQFSINTTGPIGQIQIIDIAGRVVSDTKPTGTTINVSNLSSGVYVLELISGSNIYRTRFIKE